MRPASFVELWDILLDPPITGGIVDVQSCAGSLGHLFSHVAFCASLNELSCQSTRQKSTINTVENPLTFCRSASLEEGEVQLAFHLVIAIKQRVCLSFHALHKRFLCWVKPATTSLLLGTLADWALGKIGTDRGKRTVTRASHHPPSTDQATSLPEDGPTSPGAPGQNGSDLETSAFPCPAGDTAARAA